MKSLVARIAQCAIFTVSRPTRTPFGVSLDSAGNLASMPGVFPDYAAPIIRNHGDSRELIKMRWGMPPPPAFGRPPVTNIRNTSSPHWRSWLKAENRCLVPANSFSEYAPDAKPTTGKKDVVWFALNDARPLFAFAGIWTTFKGDRGPKSKPVPGPHRVYGFLTTAPNQVVPHPSESDAGHPDDNGGMGSLDARAMGRGQVLAAAAAR
jgi:putative SOS response-associated peptidase YedK